MSFELLQRDAAARLGRFTTPHGEVTTPALLPVINPNLELFPASELRDRFGAQIVITNSYIIRQSDALRARALEEGVHELLGFDGPVMTDSGTFQAYVYGDVDVTNEEIVTFQRDMGVDIGTILDVFSTPDRTHEEALADVDTTVERARAAEAFQGEMMLAAPVQGSVYPDLRTRCAEAYAETGTGEVHPIGGVVPLMEQQRYRELVEVIVAAKQGLDPSKPVHLFGAGHPLMFPLAALLGCDLFDSASYAKFAKDDRLLTPTGTLKLKDLTELPCACPVCGDHTAADLRALPDAERARRLAEHNLHVSFGEMRRVREAIRRGTLWELVTQRAYAHPRLLDGLREALEHAGWIGAQEAESKESALFVTSAMSLRRPEVAWFRERLALRVEPPHGTVVLLPPAARPWSRTYHDVVEATRDLPVTLCVDSILGPVPLGLDGTYPAAQCELPRMSDDEGGGAASPHGGGLEAARAAAREGVLEAWDVRAIPFEGVKALREAVPERLDAPRDLLEERTRLIASLQFGPTAADALLGGEVGFETSPNTGRIRTVQADGDHVLSLRASDGLFTLKAAGGERLHEALEAPRLRVEVLGDSVPFNRDGKSVFAKFVADADPRLRPRSECLVTGPGDELVAVGRTLLTAREMGTFERGVAVEVREGVANE